MGTAMSATPLPPGVQVFERGWLSSNSILFIGTEDTTLVDSGYCTHAAQTLALVRQGLGGRALDRLVNTHLHSDHCGGNAALQSAWPALQTLIPPGQARHVQPWDAQALSYAPTGQSCPPFTFSGTLRPGQTLALGERAWEVHGAPGHDPHSVIFFEPASRTLLSADALWENGFGVVFPELEGEDAFGDVAATLDLIERLQPLTVIPGHGRVFTSVAPSLASARRRLEGFASNPDKHRLHAVKVLLAFKLMELQRQPLRGFIDWAASTPYVQSLHRNVAVPMDEWLQTLVNDLVRSGAARLDGDWVRPG